MSVLPRALLLALLATPLATAQSIGEVLTPTKIDSTTAGLGGAIADGDHFGAAVAALGDIDGDGVDDIAVGAPGADGSGSERGAVHVLFLNLDGSLKAAARIDGGTGGLSGGLRDGDGFGSSLTALDDMNGDGRRELVVGAPAASSGTNIGRVYVLFLDAGGFVTAQTRISAGEGGFGLPLTPSDPFGLSVGRVGDLDGDGIDDLAIGRNGTGSAAGSIYVCRLNADATVKTSWRLGNNSGGFQGGITGSFGDSLVGVGDLNFDGIPDLAVGDTESLCFACPGGYWIVFLTKIGTANGEVNVRGYDPIYGPVWETRIARMGSGVGALGDIDGDGVMDLALGAHFESNRSCSCGPDPEAVPEAGAVWTLRLATDGTPTIPKKINVDGVNLAGFLDPFDHFGADVDGLGDFDGDGKADVLVGAPDDDDGGTDRGAVYLLTLEGKADPAGATVYNGTHQNALCFQLTSLPRVGFNWVVNVDSSGVAGALASVVAIQGASARPPVPLLGGELLIDPFSPTITSGFVVSSGSSDALTFPVPGDATLVGARLASQGFVVGPTITLCNGAELTLGN